MLPFLPESGQETYCKTGLSYAPAAAGSIGGGDHLLQYESKENREDWWRSLAKEQRKNRRGEKQSCRGEEQSGTREGGGGEKQRKEAYRRWSGRRCLAPWLVVVAAQLRFPVSRPMCLRLSLSPALFSSGLWSIDSIPARFPLSPAQFTFPPLWYAPIFPIPSQLVRTCPGRAAEQPVTTPKRAGRRLFSLGARLTRIFWASLPVVLSSATGRLDAV
jgi:hypothetical protein